MAEEKPRGRRSKAAAASGDIYSEGEGEVEGEGLGSEPVKKKRR